MGAPRWNYSCEITQGPGKLECKTVEDTLAAHWQAASSLVAAAVAVVQSVPPDGYRRYAHAGSGGSA
eukprot:3648525-Rhodomonas_salina.2